MATKNVEKFEKLLRSDEELQSKYRTVVESYSGGKENERAFFDAVVAPLAQAASLPFNFGEAMAFMTLDTELDSAELDAISSGSYCYVIGGSEDEDVWHCTTFDNGAGACDYFGVTLLWND